MRGKRGITLVSLVVTIIVLIIIAGVSINLTLGENGIITMAKRARENMELAKVDEERQLNELYEQIIAEGGVSGNASDDAIIRLVEFKREIASAITDMGINTPENADATTMSSNIRSILGTASADKISYDNTNSNLEATNVQEVVDELNDSLENIKMLDYTTIKSVESFTLEPYGNNATLKDFTISEDGWYNFQLGNGSSKNNVFAGGIANSYGVIIWRMNTYTIVSEYMYFTSPWMYLKAGTYKYWSQSTDGMVVKKAVFD